MDLDISRYIGAVSRVVDRRERDGREVRVVVATRTYDTDCDDLWDALTSAERLPRWFLPVTGELRPGGRFQFVDNAGGEVTLCEPPRRLAVTWEFGGEVSWVEVSLAEDEGGGTRLTLEHVAHVDGDRWDKFGPGAVGVGWDLALTGLAVHLATRAPVDAAAFMAWSASDAGKQFIRGSSDGWGRASAASGTDAQAAAAAAARTTAFYTGDTDGVAASSDP